jgi:TonB family protein
MDMGSCVRTSWGWVGAMAVAVAGALAVFAAASPAQPNLFQEPVPVTTVDPVVSPNVYQGGTVVVRVSVSETGGVNNVEVVTPAPALTDSVVQAVRQWRFAPARFNDRPIAARVTVAVHVALIRNIAPPPGR